MTFRNPLRALSASQLTSGALPPGVVITAGTPGGARVDIDANGLRKYAADGTTVEVDLAADAAVFSGRVEGADIIGSTLRTALSGTKRVELSAAPGASGRLRFYDGDNAGAGEGFATIEAFPYGGASGAAQLVLSTADASLTLDFEELPAGGVQRVLRIGADKVTGPHLGSTEPVQVGAVGSPVAYEPPNWRGFTGAMNGTGNWNGAWLVRRNGFVRLTGAVQKFAGGAPALGEVIMRLPADYRPAVPEFGGTVTVRTDGTVRVESAPGTAFGFDVIYAVA